MGRQLINRIGEIHGILKITDELGKNRVKATCIICGGEAEYNKSALISGKVGKCLSCKRYNRPLEIGKGDNDLVIERIFRDAVKVMCTKCNLKRAITIEEYLSDKCYCTRCGVPLGLTSKVGSKYGRLEITRELGDNKVEARCSHCSAYGVYNRTSMLTNNGLKCIMCENGKSEYFEDIKNRIINGLKVLEEISDENDRKACKVICTDCGNMFIASKGRLLTNRSICTNCHKSVIHTNCVVCNQDVKFIRCYKSNLIKCEHCGFQVNAEVLARAKDIRQMVNDISIEYLGVALPSDFKLDSQSPVIQLSSKPKYFGYDGLPYFDAVCIEHRKKLILSNKELKAYNHELCNCEFELK